MHPRSALIPLAFVMVLDFCFTLVGQPDVYWRGSYHQCVEMSPHGKALLQAGPWYFIVAYAGWFVLVCLLASKMRNGIGTAFVMGILMGHAWGSSSWLPALISALLDVKLGDVATWYLYVGYFGLIALLCGAFFAGDLAQARKKAAMIQLMTDYYFCLALMLEAASRMKAQDPTPKPSLSVEPAS